MYGIGAGVWREQEAWHERYGVMEDRE